MKTRYLSSTPLRPRLVTLLIYTGTQATGKSYVLIFYQKSMHALSENNEMYSYYVLLLFLVVLASHRNHRLLITLKVELSGLSSGCDCISS